MVFPSPGGMGSYHAMLVEALKILGVDEISGFAIAMISFFAINLFCNVIFGLLSVILLPIINDPKELKAFLDQDKDQKIVWTNGCFDLLHEGHLFSLRKASALGDSLIVGLNSDASVKQLKGANRPVQTTMIRADVIARLSFVMAVLIFDGTSPVPELEIVRPDIFAKGADYDLSILPEAIVVRGYGGQVINLPLLEGYSTTKKIKDINENKRRH